ncbi:MAG: 16S rRNA (guanine(527)-N(7))-methyltransferase RsmG [Pseudomonadota bacterium]
MISVSKAGDLENVSRETFDRLKAFGSMLVKWNGAINLVARGTVEDMWSRHFVDSAQILQFCPPSCDHWADLGTGGGFPGLVIAILVRESRPDTRFTFVESDQRKAAFLRQASRETGANVTVLAERIELCPALAANVVSARALAPLTTLCGYAARHCQAGGTAIFQKGASYSEELEDALKNWRFDHSLHPSQTDPAAVILSITNLCRL